ncbi:hypothetical protein J2805_000799 [Arthrobacter oryzae]|nr:hypothetical protein [Arthrobacter oryzae]
MGAVSESEQLSVRSFAPRVGKSDGFASPLTRNVLIEASVRE